MIEEEHITTAKKVKSMPGWENMSDEMAETVAKTVRKLTKLFYITIARQQSLNPFPEAELRIKKPKRRKQRVRKTSKSHRMHR
ncbi:MAG: hypothetical protein HYZ14_07845 [Bacteroidetes bacterium]|nr:hypothetical protein [Bacteroidota bacterium]